MERISAFVLAHKRNVLIFWAVMFVIGAALSGAAVNRLTSDFSVTGQPGFTTAEKIDKEIKPSQNGPGIPVITVASGTVDDATNKATIDSVWAKVRKDNPSFTVVTDPRFVTSDKKSTYAMVFDKIPKSFNDLPPGIQIAKEIAKAPVAGVSVVGTGYFELSVADTQKDGKQSSGPGIAIELAFGGLGALAVLAFVFASFLAFLPIVVAAVSIPVTFAVLLPLTYIIQVNSVLEFLILFVGLGVAIDYSLLVVTRWREERDHGHTNDEAVAIAVAQAGHSVVFSGAAVAIGLLSLTVLPAPFLRSIGFGGMFIPIISTLVTITLTPAILATVGPKVDYPRIRKEATASKAWSGWARGVVKRPVVSLLAAVIMLGVLITPAFGIKLGQADVKSLAKGGPIVEAYDGLIKGGTPEGVLTPLMILTHGDPAPVVAAAGKVDGIAFAIDPGDQYAKGDAKVVIAVPTAATVNSSNTQVVGRLRSAVEPISGVVGVAGAGPVQRDYQTGIYDKFPLVIVVLSILTFLALTRAFRSIVLAIKAVVLNLISLAATFGVMVFVWQEGHGTKAIFDNQSSGVIVFWTPIMVFAFLYGLSMDYEVFILTRVREEYDEGGSTNDALIEGLGRTGRLVTSAALILFLAFVSLATQPGVDIKVLATGLGAGILLDATIIRALLVPSLVVLFGKWNWYLPDAVAKVLRIQESHAHAEPVPVTA